MPNTVQYVCPFPFVLRFLLLQDHSDHRFSVVLQKEPGFIITIYRNVIPLYLRLSRPKKTTTSLISLQWGEFLDACCCCSINRLYCN